jgi:uncharacterized protein RhaS with RHS repeats
MSTRYYHPRLQRFINADPIGFAGGMNTYAFVGNNPLTGVDSAGTQRVNAIATSFSYSDYAHQVVSQQQMAQQNRIDTWSSGAGQALRLLVPGIEAIAQWQLGNTNTAVYSAAFDTLFLVTGVAGKTAQIGKTGLRISSSYKTVSAAESAGGLFNSTMRQVEKLNFSTGRNQTVFYSGPGNRARALSFADRTGAMPIDRTPGGQFLESLKLYDNLPAAQADAIWSRASQIYASGAQGRINLFVNGARPDRVFNMIERPLLDANIDVYRWTFHY